MLFFLTLLFFIVTHPAFSQKIRSLEGGHSPIPYDPPNEQQVKFDLKYGYVESRSGTGGKIFFSKGVILQYFAVTGGDPVMTAETPDCVSDQHINEIVSTNWLKVHANKGTVFLEGIGFMFHHTNMTLIVSNQVHSILQLRATNSASVPTEISSHLGEFEMQPDATNGMALYIGDVHVLDPQMKLASEWLKADLPREQSGSGKSPTHITALTNVAIDFIGTNGEQVHTLSDKAVYDSRVASGVTNQTLELTGNPRVNMSNGWMSADTFVMDNAAGKLHGRGNVHLHYHPATQPGETVIDADEFDYDMNTRLANFAGHSHITDPRFKLSSEFLTALLPRQNSGGPNRLDHAVADTNVVIEFINGTGTNRQIIHANGQKAVYDSKVAGGTTNEVLELTGNPAVQLDKGWMTADVIKVDRAQGHIWGTGNHHSVFKKQPGAPATSDTEIFSDDFEYFNNTGLAYYKKNARAYDPALNLRRADLITVELAKGPNGATNVHKVIAEGNVSLDFADKPFVAKDITNLSALAMSLKEPPDAVTVFVRKKLSPLSELLLSRYSGGTDDALRQSLADDLNRIAQNGLVYDTARFTNVFLSRDTEQLLKHDPMGLDLIQANRLLLLDAFRGEMARGKNGEVTHATGDRAVYTSQGQDATASAYLELIGHPRVINPSISVEADDFITYDRLTQVYRFMGNPRFHSSKIGAFATAPAPGKKEKP